MTLTLTALFEHLTGVVDAEAWREHANCRGLGPDLFYAGRGESQAEALTICCGCLVRTECLEHALSEPERFGMWAATSERERKRLRRGKRLEVVG